MVWGHSGAPFKHFIYLFHMAIFFIASGYMWNDRHAESLESCVKYIASKIKTLWIPFSVCNLIFTLCNNLFIRIGFYTDNEMLLELSVGANDALIYNMSLKQTIIQVLQNLTFGGDTQLGGATWFLRTLFIVLMGNLVLRFLFIHLRIGKLEIGKVFYWICLVGIIVMAQLVSRYDLTFPRGIHTFFEGYVAFAIGMLLRKYNVMQLVKKQLLIWWIAAFLVLIGLNNVGSIGMSSASITNVVFFVVVSFAGWIFLYGMATVIRKWKFSNTVAYIGQHTLWILMLHFISFKIVSLVYVLISGSDWLYLAAYPCIANVPGLWIAYVIVGVALPLGAEWAIKTGMKKAVGAFRR